MSGYLHVSTREINEIQVQIMQFIDNWVRTEKTPVPLREVVAVMLVNQTKECTTMNALRSLIRKGYIRKGAVISNRTTYVQLRRI